MSTEENLISAADKTGVIGAIVAAIGCAACFPVLGSLGAAIGLGFLSQFEGTLVAYVLPLFAIIALVANFMGGLRRRHWPRMLLGIIGPLLVLAAALLMSIGGIRAEWLLYPGLLLMIAVSLWDMFSRLQKNRRPAPLPRGAE